MKTRAGSFTVYVCVAFSLEEGCSGVGESLIGGGFIHLLVSILGMMWVSHLLPPSASGVSGTNYLCPG